jgi:RHH-type proline utilization regulon transcriptional repressor/proline dehydrogenase/delta 1-pyrroline-5-carboxylate dehydrogenase
MGFDVALAGLGGAPEQGGALGQARALLERARDGASEQDGELSCELASALWQASRALESGTERRRRERTARLVADGVGQRFATALTDRACRIEEPKRRLEQVSELVRILGIPQSLGAFERAGLAALPHVAPLFPEALAEALSFKVAREADAYVVRGEEHELERFLAWSARQGSAVNLNHLGEEVIGEAQAQLHGAHYHALLDRPDVTTLSVKLSSLYSQVSLLAFEETLHVLAERLRPIYGKAAAATPPKLVYLDMESYRDLDITFTLFTRLLDEPELRGLTAGIVLQAYLADSHHYQKRLVAWARRRVVTGGAPVRLRLVKGANLAMERVESSLRGWPVPILPSKADVDAHFKHMLRYACLPESIEAVRLGVGSHNVFDIAYALVLRERLENPEWLELEMLHGMAEPVRRAVQALTENVLVYVPAVEPKELQSAVAYLVRRFDENAAEENFLRMGFSVEAGDGRFAEEGARFRDAMGRGKELPTRRPAQRVGGLGVQLVSPEQGRTHFVNEADTDLSRPGDREFLRSCLRTQTSPVPLVPLVIGDDEIFEGPRAAGFDPSRPGLVPYEHRLATASEIEQSLAVARRASGAWGARPASERVAILRNVAAELRRARAELISAMVLDGGKRAEEADAEVSEAVDFAEYYATSFEEHAARYVLAPKGVVVVTPPWNFPLAIPLSGTLAGLVAGNAVLLKPAPETVLVAYLGARACWRAGVPREALGFVPCREDVAGRLITDPRVDVVVLTGATETARLFRRMRPGLDLLAETGGKNALILSSVGDHELAIRDAVRSAFGHAGQKCSALSQLIVERPLYGSDDFRRQLHDAAASLRVGSAWDPESFVTPLIHPPSSTLERGLRAEHGERWLLHPSRSRENPRLLGPGIKLDVPRGGFTHRTELFGPLLAVLEAEDFEEALALANDTPYGLTAGFHGLDEREQAAFIERMQAGNLYVNRTITGAIVGRQPFGGRKASCFGPGAKAGGPNYVLQLCRVLGYRPGLWPQGEPAGSDGALGAGQSTTSPVSTARSLVRFLGHADRERFEERAREYTLALARLREPRLLQDLVGEANWFRHQPCRLAVVLGQGASALDLASVLLAIELAAAHAVLLVLESHGAPAHVSWLLESGRAQRVDSLGSVASLLEAHSLSRARFLGVDRHEGVSALGTLDAHLMFDPVSEVGQVELLRYLMEQSVSITQHRYGNLGMAAASPRPRAIGKGRASP